MVNKKKKKPNKKLYYCIQDQSVGHNCKHNVNFSLNYNVDAANFNRRLFTLDV